MKVPREQGPRSPLWLCLAEWNLSPTPPALFYSDELSPRHLFSRSIHHVFVYLIIPLLVKKKNPKLMLYGQLPSWLWGSCQLTDLWRCTERGRQKDSASAESAPLL